MATSLISGSFVESFLASFSLVAFLVILLQVVWLFVSPPLSALSLFHVSVCACSLVVFLLFPSCLLKGLCDFAVSILSSPWLLIVSIVSLRAS